MKRLMLACGVAGLLGVVSVAFAQEPDTRNWAEKMFSELKHDFGNVAAGADVRHQIEIKNLYKEPVTIDNVSTTCGCTIPSQPSIKTIKTGETSIIEFQMNTTKFKRQKNSNVVVNVSFTDAAGRRNTKEVRVPISAYIRPDVVLTPGGADFGSLEQGAPAQKTISIEYAGRENWSIRDVKTGSPYVTASVQETSRAGGRVAYQLLVNVLPTAPLGTVHDQITLVTDDATNPHVPVLVDAKVEPDIVITPSSLPLGTLTPGAEKTYSVVVRGRRPFAIDKIECDSERECFKVQLPKDAKSVHIVPLTVTAPETPGEFTEHFTLTIDGRPEPLTFTAEGNIASPGT